jgi:2,4-dienoyl-CoA reductase (NADPH2)
MAKAVPGKEEFNETIRYFKRMLEKYNVNVR